MTESIYFNSLSYQQIWSTVKTLPATLPEPSSQVQVPTIALIGPGKGVTDAIWLSALGLIRGVGVKRDRYAALKPFDKPAEGFF